MLRLNTATTVFNLIKHQSCELLQPTSEKVSRFEVPALPIARVGSATPKLEYSAFTTGGNEVTNEIQLSIVEKACAFLGIANGTPALDLCVQLREYRKTMHPDRFFDELSKKAGAEKFKEAQSLLDELQRFVQDQALNAKPSELIHHKPTLDQVLAQASLDDALKEIDTLKQQLGWRETQVKELTEKLAAKNRIAFDAERDRIEKLYKPGPQKWAPLGVVILLSIAIAVISKVEQVSEKLELYSPINDSVLSTMVFLVIVLAILITLKQVVENAIMGRKLGRSVPLKQQLSFATFSQSQRYLSRARVLRSLKFSVSSTASHVGGRSSCRS